MVVSTLEIIQKGSSTYTDILTVFNSGINIGNRAIALYEKECIACVHSCALSFVPEESVPEMLDIRYNEIPEKFSPVATYFETT